MVKRKKKKDPFGFAAYIPAVPFLKAPEEEWNVFFKGFDSILEQYKDIDTDAELENARKKMAGALQLKTEEGGPPLVLSLIHI